MAVAVRCPGCQKNVGVSEDHLGLFVRCPHCGRYFTRVPGAVGSNRGSAQTAPPGGKDLVKAPCHSEAAGRVTRSPARATQPSRPADRGVLPSRIGRFEVRGKLGAGAFGTVYRAYDPQLEREVALKVPRPGTMDDPKMVERFLREAKAAARLRH